jgi:hypothetical protein
VQDRCRSPAQKCRIASPPRPARPTIRPCSTFWRRTTDGSHQDTCRCRKKCQCPSRRESGTLQSPSQYSLGVPVQRCVGVGVGVCASFARARRGWTACELGESCFASHRDGVFVVDRPLVLAQIGTTVPHDSSRILGVVDGVEHRPLASGTLPRGPTPSHAPTA